MTDNRTTELIRLLEERGIEWKDGDAAYEIEWNTPDGRRCSAMYWNPTFTVLVSGCTPEQAIAATLGSGMHVYVLRGTDPGSMPSCGGETNELLAVYATREAAEKAKSEWRGYCDLNITELEVA